MSVHFSGSGELMGYSYPRSYLFLNRNGCTTVTQAQSYAGNYCGALIQKDGWKISDDYPW